MRLGHTPVAVKLFQRGGKLDSFPKEEAIWWHLEGRNVSPRLYATGTTTNGRFSYIVTEVGISLDRMLSGIHYEYKWSPKDEVGVSKFLEEQVACYPLQDLRDRCKPTLPANEHERIQLVARLVRGMILCQRRLESVGVLHRDLKVSNFVLMPDSGEVRLIDFGTSLRPKLCLNHKNEYDAFTIKEPRGSLRMYPIPAIDSFYYDFACDEYVLADASFEVISERPIYHECRNSVEKAIMKRRQAVHPSWFAEFLAELDGLCQENDEGALFLRNQVSMCESTWSSYDNGSFPSRRTPRRC